MHIRNKFRMTFFVISMVASQIAYAAPVRTVDACDTAVGTDVSQALPGATISYVKSGDYDSPSDFFSAVGDPVLVEAGSHGSGPGGEPVPLPSVCLDRSFSGSTYYLTSLLERDLTPDSGPLHDGIWAIKVDFAGGAKSVSVTGTGFWDYIAAVMYDANGNWIPDSALSGKSVYEEFAVCGQGEACDDPYLGYVNTISFSLVTGAPISTMFIGAGHDVPASITRISYSPFYVPEPGILGLLLVGLILLALIRREAWA